MTKQASAQAAKTEGKRLSRRKFLGAGGAAAALGAVGVLAASRALNPLQAKAHTEAGVKHGMVIDLSRCMGCRACMEACKVENNTGPGIFWMYVFRFEEGDYPHVKVRYLPRPCMHCDNAPCAKVCPVGARYKREDGLVATDAERCIGCRYCQVACPYSVNYFNWNDPAKSQYLDWGMSDAVKASTRGAVPPYKNSEFEEKYGEEKRKIAGSGHFKGVIEKCTFCVHRVEKGLAPACVANCPVKALNFGDLNDPESEVSKMLVHKPAFRLAEEFDTQPRVYYVGQTPPSTEARQIEPIIGRV